MFPIEALEMLKKTKSKPSMASSHFDGCVGKKGFWETTQKISHPALSPPEKEKRKKHTRPPASILSQPEKKPKMWLIEIWK